MNADRLKLLATPRTTARTFTTASAALDDALARTLKATWENTKSGRYAVGDWSDLPAHGSGLWQEISLLDLADAARKEWALVTGLFSPVDPPPHSDASVRWDLEPEGTDR
jgi:hypothetical protein